MPAKLDSKMVEQIIAKAREYTRMSNPLTAETAVLKASRELVGQSNQWGAYKTAAEKKFLSRLEKAKEAKKEKLLRGAAEAASARRDDEIEEAEAAEERLSEARMRAGRER